MTAGNSVPPRPSDKALKAAVRVKVTANGTPYVSRATAAMGPRSVYDLVVRKLLELGKLKH